MVHHILVHLNPHQLKRRVHRADKGQKFLYFLADLEIDDMARLSLDIFRLKADFVKQLNEVVAKSLIRDGKLKMIVFSGELTVPQAIKTPRRNEPKQQSSGRFARFMRREMSLSL